ncbi:MAG: transaldolase [Pseudomonadota bacterium]
MSIKIFVDGANLEDMLTHYQHTPDIAGFTTNPSLMKKAGVTDYHAFAQEVLEKIPDRPISFEVFADALDQMEQQANNIATWGDNIYIKIPVSNTKGISTAPLVNKLSKAGIKLNITAIFTHQQIDEVIDNLDSKTPAIVSIFAGRIADSGIDPIPTMRYAVELARKKNLPLCEILWASTREAFNIKQAEQCGCHIITVPPTLITAAHKNFGKSLEQYSLDTVKAFYQDAQAAGFNIN